MRRSEETLFLEKSGIVTEDAAVRETAAKLGIRSLTTPDFTELSGGNSGH